MSKGQDQQQDQKNIDTVLSSEANSLTKMQNAIGELLEANQQLKDSVELKQQVDVLKKEAPSLPWFKRFVQIIPQVKYLFIKNDEQIAAERREINREILTYVDNTLTKVGKKSSSLQVIIDKELQIGLAKVLYKKLSDDQSKRVGELQKHLSSLDVSQKDFRKIVPEVYNANETAALMHERTQLTQIQQDITNLVIANSKVQGLLTIKKELAELQQALPSTWLDNLKKSVAKIKDAFIKNPEQILKDTVVKNNTTLLYVDNALKTTGKIIESSKLARKNKLHKELENLQKRELSSEQSDRVKLLSSTIDLTLAKTVAISGPLFTMNKEQAQSQSLYSSMPNLQTTSLRPAPPPPHLANTSLPNIAIQQPNVAATIPPAPPLPEQSAQQAAISSIPRPTFSPPPPPLTRATSLPDINAPKPEENARRASTLSRRVKRQAPLPPTQATSLHNLAQQPNVASAAIPPAPPLPPPPHEVPGLQQGAHQVGTPIVPLPLPAEPNIPTPPPLPAGGFNTPPPPPPPPPADQPKNPVAASSIEGQENRGLREGATQPKAESSAQDDLFAAIKAGKDGGFNLKKTSEIKKDGGTGEVKPEAETNDITSIMKKALEGRAKAFRGDEEDEHEHADLVKFIENKKVNESSLISTLHTDCPEAQDIKSKQALIKFIEQDLTGDWGDGEFEKQEEIIKKLETIKGKYENNNLDLSAKPVVDAAKGEISTDVVAKAQAIGQTLQKPENVAGQASKPPPAPPLPPKTRSSGTQGL